MHYPAELHLAASRSKYIFKFAFMGKFLELYRFVPTTTSTTTLDQPTLLDDLNPQLG